MEPTLPTQTFVEIKEIKGDTIYLTKGGLRRILIVNGVNFDLKSEAEQILILNSFQNFLNTLDFPVQFFIHSRKVNVDRYLEKITERKVQETNELLKIQIEEYMEFIRAFVAENPIITKSFFIGVYYDPATTSSSSTSFFSLFSSSKKNQQHNQDKDVEVTRGLEQLQYRVDQVMSGLATVGLRAVPLHNEELIELFYNLYNPQLTDKKGLEIAKQH